MRGWQRHTLGALWSCAAGLTHFGQAKAEREAPAGEIRRHAVAQAMVTLREDAWAKACAGLTTVEEILRVTQEDT